MTPVLAAGLSAYQRARWLQGQLTPGGQPDSVRAVRVRGPLQADALRLRLDALVARHAALRTAFHAGEDGPHAVVHEPSPADLRILEAAGPDLAALVEAEARAGRGDGAAVRARLYRPGEQEHVLALFAGPAALDHRSLALALLELLTGERAGAPPDARPAADADGERLWAYWRARLDGGPATLDLAPARAAATGAVASAATVLDAATSDRLRRLAASAGAPVHAALLAAVQLLLRRYTGVADVAVGLPVALGPAPLGWHVNTVVLRQDLSEDAPVGALLRAVAGGLASALDHRALPFDALVRRLDPAGARGAGLLQVTVEVDALLAPGADGPLAALALGEDGDERRLGDLLVQPLALAPEPPAGDLALRIATAGDRLRVRFVHDPGRLPGPVVDCLRRDLLALLARMAADAAQPALGLLERSATEERVRPDPSRLHAPDAAFVAFPARDLEGCLLARFLDRARRDPGRTAVMAEDGELTYAGLARRAAAVAAAIRAACGPGEGRVGLLLDHGPGMIEAILGVLGAGRTYVPLDPTYPVDRLAYMLEHSGAEAVLAGGGHRALALALRDRAGRPGPRLLDAPGAAGGAGLEALDAGVAAGRPAYVLYTSGSTGRPKGVVQDHRNVLFQVRCHTNDHRISPRDRLSLVASFSFDASVTDLFGALLNGAAVVPFDVRRHGAGRLARALVEREVSVLHATPTLYRHLLAGLDEGEVLPAIRLVLLGGEEVTDRDVRLARRHLPERCVLVNGYGATEVSFALRNHVTADDPVDPGPVPMGWPLEGIEVALLGPDGRPACLRGEIEVRSRHVAPGYWGDGRTTDERFRPLPGGVRAYRTGDLGRRLPDGRIAFAGRRDRQVKVRGHRVELGEIEAVLAGSQAVAQAVAVPRAEGVVAYVVPASPAAADLAASLRPVLERALPHYMLPAAIVVLDRLPLTPTGKVDVRALPAPARARSAIAAPRDDIERAIAGAWCAVLDLDDVGLDDGFFELGGHSLLLAAVQVRVERALGVEIPLHRMLAHPTVGSLARFLRGQAAPAAEDAMRRVEARMDRRRRARAAGG